MKKRQLEYLKDSFHHDSEGTPEYISAETSGSKLENMQEPAFEVKVNTFELNSDGIKNNLLIILRGNLLVRLVKSLKKEKI